jgi:hypothetical protein
VATAISVSQVQHDRSIFNNTRRHQGCANTCTWQASTRRGAAWLIPLCNAQKSLDLKIEVRKIGLVAMHNSLTGLNHQT